MKLKQFEVQEYQCNAHYYDSDEIAQLSDFDDHDVKNIDSLEINDSCVIHGIVVKRLF